MIKVVLKNDENIAKYSNLRGFTQTWSSNKKSKQKITITKTTVNRVKLHKSNTEDLLIVIYL